MKNILVLILLFCLSIPAFTQNEEASSNSYFLGMSPQFIFINGFRLDFEKRFNESNHALSISPTYYVGDIDYNTLLNSNNYDYELNGAGAEIAHKIYTQKTWNRSVNWYQGYSLTYNYLNFKYDGVAWTPIGNNNPGVLALRDKDQSLTIHQIVLATFVGAQVKLDERLFFDLYLGIGAKRSIADDSSTDNLAEEDFQSGFINYNFSGALFKAGMKVGMTF